MITDHAMVGLVLISALRLDGLSCAAGLVLSLVQEMEGAAHSRSVIVLLPFC